MKKLFLPTLLFFILISCKTSIKDSFKHTPNDTTKVFLVYSQGKDGIRYDVGFRVGVDSLMYVDTDSSTKVKKWNRYRMYFAPIIDTIRDAKGIAVRDSTGKYNFRTIYYNVYSGAIIRDVNINVDSLVKNYKPNF